MARFPVLVLMLMSLINLGRGAIHTFAPDGGAHSIAGLDLTHDRQTILSLLAVLGLGQMLKGAVQLYIVARRRDLVGLFLEAVVAIGVGNFVGDAGGFLLVFAVEENVSLERRR